MTDQTAEARYHVAIFWAGQDFRSDDRTMTMAQMHELFVRDPLVMTIYDKDAETVRFERNAFNRAHVEAAYGPIPAHFDAIAVWE
jgi:hypothetical protein